MNGDRAVTELDKFLEERHRRFRFRVANVTWVKLL